MANGGVGEHGKSGDRSKPRAKVSPARNVVGLVLLVAFSGAAIFEVMANRGYNGAVTKLEKRLPKDETDPNDKNSGLPTQAEAEKLIGKGPDGPLVKEGSEQRGTYSWQGLRRKYSLKVYYTNEKVPSVIRLDTQ